MFKGRSFKTASASTSLNGWAKETELPLEIKKTGEGRAYYEIRMTYFPIEPQPFREEGLSVFKNIEILEGKRYKDGSFAAGSLVKIILQIVNPHDRNYVVVDDPLPAGFEPIDTSLKTESQEVARKLQEARERAQSEEERWRWWGSFNHTEIGDDSVRIFADYLISGIHTFVYLARATSYGDFSMPSTTAECMYEPEIFGWSEAGKIKVVRAIEPLIVALRDENLSVRRNAASALDEIVEQLIVALKDEDIDVRLDVAWALGEIKNTRAVEPLILALKDGDSTVRLAAARALSKIKDARAVAPLISALKDEDAVVRMYVALALSEIKDTRAVEPLIAALKDEDSDVRKSAAEALGEIKDARAVEPLIATLKDKDSDVRWGAALALDIIGDVKAQEALNLFLKDIDLKKVVDDYKSFIAKGKEGTEGLLIFVLHRYGSETMADDFFNCGNWKLKEAAERWAKRHSFTSFKDRGYSIPSGKKEHPGWGSSKR